MQENEQEQKQLDLATFQKIELLLYKVLTPEARERLANVRLVNMERYLQIVGVLMNMYQSGRISEPLDEESLKELLIQTSTARDFNITRK